MNLYHYDKYTKEYLLMSVAEADPAETKKQGKFVPLVPANATLIVPPSLEINQVAVFTNNKWEIKPDYRRNYVKVDDKLNVLPIDTIGEQEGFYVVDKSTGDLIKENPDKYKISGGNVIAKTNSEYEQEQAQKERQRLNLLNLTKEDVLLALYQDKGITPEDIKTMLKDNVEALIKFDYASSYYRGDEVVNALGLALGYTTEEMDYLFENKTFPQDVSSDTDDDSDTDNDSDSDTDNDTDTDVEPEA